MSLRTLPLLFINLGGEMLYILDQRLRAQNIPVDKSRKVMHDIIGTMFNKRFMDELFKPQEAYSKKAMRTVFDRLAHASIMRLNTASMDKLYDLMTMAFKYQVSLCLRPSDLLLVTFNHMDAIRVFVEDSPPIKGQVDNVYRLLIQHYASLPAGEFQIIRQTLLEFFEDMHIRVSIFLKDKVQNSNGRFALPGNGPVPYGSDIPGTIRYFTNGSQVTSKEFPVTGKYMASLREGSFDMKGDRVTKLGTNMYNVSRPVETQISSSRQKGASASSDVDSNNPNPLAKAELNLLAHLMGSIGKEAETKRDKGFRINLFQNDAEEEQYAVNRPPQYDFKVINIDFSKLKGNDELSKIMGDLAIPDSGASGSKGDDLLELMDSAS